MFKMKVNGLEELQKTLKALGKDIADVLEEGTLAGADVVVRAAQENSRKGGDNFPHRITGNLFRNIAQVSPISVERSSERCEVMVGSTMNYAMRLEKGFNDTDSRGRRYHQPPRPFLRPALDENTGEVERAIALKLEKLIRSYR